MRPPPVPLPDLDAVLGRRRGEEVSVEVRDAGEDARPVGPHLVVAREGPTGVRGLLAAVVRREAGDNASTSSAFIATSSRSIISATANPLVTPATAGTVAAQRCGEYRAPPRPASPGRRSSTEIRRWVPRGRTEVVCPRRPGRVALPADDQTGWRLPGQVEKPGPERARPGQYREPSCQERVASEPAAARPRHGLDGQPRAEGGDGPAGGRRRRRRGRRGRPARTRRAPGGPVELRSDVGVGVPPGSTPSCTWPRTVGPRRRGTRCSG